MKFLNSCFLAKKTLLYSKFILFSRSDGKNKQIVFKYLTELHDENVLKDFLSRSKYSDRIDIDTTTKQITSDPKFKLEYANFQAKLYKKTKSAHKVKK